MDALLKYKFYKQFGIDPQHVAPYREEWLQNAIGLVPQAPPPLVSQVCSIHKPAVSAPVVVLHLHWVGNLTACTSALQQSQSNCAPCAPGLLIGFWVLMLGVLASTP